MGVGYLAAGISFVVIGALSLFAAPAIGRLMHAVLGRQVAESVGWRTDQKGRFQAARMVAFAAIALGVVILYVGVLDYLIG